MKRILGDLRRRLASRVAEPELSELRRLEEAHEELASDHHAVVHDRDLLRRHLEDLEARHHAVAAELKVYTDDRFLRWRSPGHFYSPVPDGEELRRRRLGHLDRSVAEIPGVDLAPGAQVELWTELAPLIDFDIVAHDGSGDFRFRVPNASFNLPDAALYSAMLRHIRPSRVVEVGSGYTSALLLDVVERHLHDVSVAFVEPYPEVLLGLLRDSDEDNVEIFDQPVQDVPLELFTELGAGDLLFIDSTHVLKPGSDVVDLYTKVLPALAPGVVVHIHDIFHPFEYPSAWIEEGRAWNEIYLLRTMLSGRSDFEILFFNNWFAHVNGDRLLAVDERLRQEDGGSIWLRRRDGG